MWYHISQNSVNRSAPIHPKHQVPAVRRTYDYSCRARQSCDVPAVPRPPGMLAARKLFFAANSTSICAHPDLYVSTSRLYLWPSRLASRLKDNFFCCGTAPSQRPKKTALCKRKQNEDVYMMGMQDSCSRVDGLLNDADCLLTSEYLLAAECGVVLIDCLLNVH